MKRISPIGTIALVAMLSTSISDVSAECRMPDPPMFHAQDRIFAFESLNAIQQEEVQAFEKFPSSTKKANLTVESLTGVSRFCTEARRAGDLDEDSPCNKPDNPPSIPPDDTLKKFPDPRTADIRYLNPDHPGGQPTIPQSDWKRVNCVNTRYDTLDVANNKGCGFRMELVSDAANQQKKIDEFEKEHKRSKAKCEILIIHATDTPDVWTLAGFSDSGEFNTVLVSDELSVAFKEKIVNKKEVLRLALVELKRSQDKVDTPPSFVGTLPYVQSPDGIRTTFIRTAQGLFPDEVEIDGKKQIVDPYANPPGTNMLPTVFANIRNSSGKEMLNTLPSTKANPYNLHAEEPTATRINPESPADDLKYIMTSLYEVIADEPYEQYLISADKVSLQDKIDDSEGASARVAASRSMMEHHIQWALDIIEGNGKMGTKVPESRAYRGFALLNHSGHKRVKRVMPIYDANGDITGGEVTIRQLWYGGRIQSDTMFLDFGYEKSGPDVDYANCGGKDQPSQEACKKLPPIPPNKGWNINFEINVLNKGNDDFSPMTMHFDCPSKLEVDTMPDLVKCPDSKVNIPVGKTSWSNGPLYVSMDQSFFPMNDGTRVDLTLEMAPPQFYNLTYSWGWRVHPPRAQAVENGEKVVPPPVSDNKKTPSLDNIQMYCHPLRAAIIEHERWAFEGFPGPSKLPDGVGFPEVKDLAKMMGLALPEGTPMGSGERIDACFEQFQKAIEEHPHFVQAGKALREQCKGRKPIPGSKPTPPDMMDARLCLLNVLFPPPVAAYDLTHQDYYDPAIDKIADIAPAKRMWRAFRAMRTDVKKDTPPGAEAWLPRLRELRSAYVDWLDRTRLPSGVQPDPKSDLTMLYANNTIYGQLRTGGYVEFPDWRRRGDMVKITLLNADYFTHGYLNVDFGGARGWENLWQSTVKTAGSGPWFTFGRFHSRFNTVPGSIAVGPARKLGNSNAIGAPGTVQLSAHRLMLQFNFEPNPRLRFYQFDPLHHDVSIYSIH